jgi:predicted transposase/invertase (TIGR01784 family)
LKNAALTTRPKTIEKSTPMCYHKFMEESAMAKLKHTLTNDILFRLLFTKYPNLLKRLIAALLGIAYESIEQFYITNQDIPPEEMGKKFCRLDINMVVDGRHITLEIQVDNQGNFPERSLYYWAREFSNALSEGQDYALLPRTIIISILGFNQFPDPNRYCREFQCLEVSTHEPLCDKQVLFFFELKKLPPLDGDDSGRDLWLKLFRADTEEELKKIEEMGVPFMSEAVSAYRHVAASDEFREIERMRSKARHEEAQAISNAEQRAEQRRDEHWQGVVAEKDSVLAEKDSALAEKDSALAEKDSALAEKDSVLAEKDSALAEQAALIAELRSQLIKS